MIPSLLTFTLLTALVLLVAGLPLAVAPKRLEPILRAFPRHRATAIVTMLLGGGWFLFKISQLGPADFGDYKVILFLLFAATLAGSILYVPDFLAVRGVAILVLLAANTGLKSAFGLYDIPERLLLVTILYILIVAAITYGIMPYRMRETIAWLYAGALRARVLGMLISFSGLSLVVAASLY